MLVILVFFTCNILPCSIVGYIGNLSCKQFILNGLQKLEYRGYDSAGLALLDQIENNITLIKAEGVLKNLVRVSSEYNNKYQYGIGHTRWATHGSATVSNAHPQCNQDKSIALVHNGIIENHFELKQELNNKSIKFISETDTEVIPHLFDLEVKRSKNLKEITLNVVNKLEGSFAFLALFKDKDKIVAARKGSPLCIGLGDGENFVASDCIAFADRTNRVIYLPENSFALVSKDEIEIFDFNGKQLFLQPQIVDIDHNTFDLTGYKHYMLKEIHDQPNVIRGCIDSLVHESDFIKNLGLDLKNLKSINILGCGTSWHAARIAQFFFEEICKIPTHVYLASEFRYMPFFPQKDSVYIAISQSGETADTLEAIRLINRYSLPTLAVTNVLSSSMVRECTAHLLSKAGPEIAVAATKSFTAQLGALYYLAQVIAKEKGLVNSEQFKENITKVYQAADILEYTIKHYSQSLKEYAKKYCHSERFIFLGRHIGYPFAMEAALKLKEISYIFAMGYPAGELKHGSIALIDVKTPVMTFSHPDKTIYQKILSNAQEVKARNGHLIVVAFAGQEELIKLADLAIVIPEIDSLLSPIAMAGIMQEFVYNIADELGCSIDKPRNLAKSVTVE